MTKTLKKEIERIMVSQGFSSSIELFPKKANWYSLSLCQPLSIEFIEYFIDNINWSSFLINKQIPEEIKQKFSCNF